MRAPNYSRVKAEVRDVRDELGLDAPPINPARAARNLGIDVVFVEFSDEHSSISGLYDPERNAILVNKHEYPKRQTFTIAHELGHALLHREWARSEDYAVLMRDGETDVGEPHEKEANAFAANLLVPRDLLDRYRDLSVDDLSTLFVVSPETIRNRLKFEYGRNP